MVNKPKIYSIRLEEEGYEPEQSFVVESSLPLSVVSPIEKASLKDLYDKLAENVEVYYSDIISLIFIKSMDPGIYYML